MKQEWPLWTLIRNEKADHMLILSEKHWLGAEHVTLAPGASDFVIEDFVIEDRQILDTPEIKCLCFSKDNFRSALPDPHGKYFPYYNTVVTKDPFQTIRNYQVLDEYFKSGGL